LPVFGRKPIDNLTRGEIRDFLLDKFNNGLSKTRTLMIKDLISSVLRYALDDELISANPVAGLQKNYFRKIAAKLSQSTKRTFTPKRKLKSYWQLARPCILIIICFS
jgi:hypothetical protein